MALLRSDVINRELLEQVLKKVEGTNRVTVTVITTGPCEAKGSLLEERLRIQVSAQIKGRPKNYDWTAKVLRAESGPANYARFQGLLETEVNFYHQFLPEIQELKTVLPKTFPYLWGDCKTLNKEVLLLEKEPEFYLATKRSLDLPHVLLAVEWLARLHGLSWVLQKRLEDQDPNYDFAAQHPWIRKELEDSSKLNPTEMETVDQDEAGSSLKARLVNMARKTLQLEEKPEKDDSLDKLLERQDWLDEMRNSASKKWNKSGDFVTVCHGQPWSGNAYFKYSTDPEGGQVPTEVIFSDFQSCALGKPGQDISHFLLSSTTREFRQDNLETILQAYLTELEDVITHQGVFDGPLYTSTALRQDYRQGIYLAMTFCLFAMPVLTQGDEEEIDGSLQGDDKVDGIELRETPMKGMQRAADALLDYINVGI